MPATRARWTGPPQGSFASSPPRIRPPKFILTVRSPQSWADSFSQTIYPFVTERDRVRDEMLPWVDMAARVVARTGFAGGLDSSGLQRAFVAHGEAVKATILAQQLLVYQVKDGWGPALRSS